LLLLLLLLLLLMMMTDNNVNVTVITSQPRDQILPGLSKWKRRLLSILPYFTDK